jgi:hypothetical protein
MRVTVVRGGGIAGRVVTTVVDDAELDDARTERLRSVVAGCSFRERSGPVAPAMRDGFSYEVTVDADDGSSQGVRFVQGTAPDGMGELLRFVDDEAAGREERGR